EPRTRSAEPRARGVRSLARRGAVRDIHAAPSAAHPSATPERAVNPVRALGGAAILGARATVAVRRVPPRLFLRELWLQLDQIAFRSAGLVISGMAFFGAVMVTIANAQTRRFTGNLVVLGPAYFELLLRELGP